MQKVFDFKVFSLSECAGQCHGCFFEKHSRMRYMNWNIIENWYNELIKKGFYSRSLILAPTDIFNDPYAINILKHSEFINIANKFENLYFGSTFETLDSNILSILNSYENNIYIQINLNLDKIESFEYFYDICSKIGIIQSELKKVFFVIAINSGLEIKNYDLNRIMKFRTLSSDGTDIEFGITFTENLKIPIPKQKYMIERTLELINHIREDKSNSHPENVFGNINQLKNDFVLSFIDDVYLEMTIPYDESVTIRNSRFKVHSIEHLFHLFDTINDRQLDNECHNCKFNWQNYCKNKGFLEIKNLYELKCFLRY